MYVWMRYICVGGAWDEIVRLDGVGVGLTGM